MTTGIPDISICICTFRRPAMLERLLEAISAQAYGKLHVEVVVVDNDPQASALPVLQHWQSRLPFVLSVFHEPVPNIAAARNRAMHAAQGHWVLLIDDDEIPGENWIKHIYATRQRYQADAVFGPVLPAYGKKTPAWIERGNFFYRRRFRTGTPITTHDARTGNVLIRRHLLMQIPGPFNTAFGRTGAEDTVLFKTMLKQRAVLIWCDEATVSEEVPPARANLTWLLRRSYRLGQTFILSELSDRTGIDRFLQTCYLGTRAFVQCGVAVVIALATLPLSRITSVRWTRIAVAQCGKISAIFGHRYYEYGQ